MWRDQVLERLIKVFKRKVSGSCRETRLKGQQVLVQPGITDTATLTFQLLHFLVSIFCLFFSPLFYLTLHLGSHTGCAYTFLPRIMWFITDMSLVLCPFLSLWCCWTWEMLYVLVSDVLQKKVKVVAKWFSVSQQPTNQLIISCLEEPVHVWGGIIAC